MIGFPVVAIVSARHGAVSPATADACNHAATLLDVVAPDLPDSARYLGLGQVNVLIDVRLDLAGTLVSATIAKSSGNAAIDRSALRAARRGRYAAAEENCRRIPGRYLLRVTFSGG